MRAPSFLAMLGFTACTRAIPPPSKGSTPTSSATAPSVVASASPPKATKMPAVERARFLARAWADRARGAANATDGFERVVDALEEPLVRGVGDFAPSLVSPSAAFVAIATDEGVVVVDVARSRAVTWVAGASPSWPNDRVLVVHAPDDTAVLIDPATGDVVASYDHPLPIFFPYSDARGGSIATGTDLRVLAPTSLDGGGVSIGSYDAVAKKEGTPFTVSDGPSLLQELVLAPDGDALLVGLSDGSSLWERQGTTFVKLGAFPPPQLPVYEGAFDPTGRYVAIVSSEDPPKGSSYSGAVAIFDRKKRVVTAHLGGLPYPSSATWSLDGSRLAVGDLRTARVYEAKTWKLLRATAPIRETFMGDDLQAVHRSAFVGNDVLVLETDDGTEGIVRVSSGKLTSAVNANGTRWYSTKDALYVVTTNTLDHVDATGTRTTRSLTADEAAHDDVIPELSFTLGAHLAARTSAEGVAMHLCSARGLVFPEEICAAHGL